MNQAWDHFQPQAQPLLREMSHVVRNVLVLVLWHLIVSSFIKYHMSCIACVLCHVFMYFLVSYAATCVYLSLTSNRK